MEKPWLDEQLEDPEFCKGLIKELSTQYQDDLADLRRKLEEAKDKLYVPGSWRCPKCKLELDARLLSDDVYADTSPQKCLGACGPMWRVSYQDRVEDFADAQDALMSEKSDLQAQVEALKGALHDIAGGHTSQYADAPDVMTAESPAAFRHAMWTWSQRIAKDALAQSEPVEEADSEQED